MALSMGGGSLINAIMGQHGSAQRQRRQQQDQLMQMMQRGFVPTEAARQAREDEGLLSQLLAPPERMRAQDFKTAPWSPYEMAKEERQHEVTEAEKQRKAENDRAARREQHEERMARQEARDQRARDAQKRGHERAMQRTRSQDERDRLEQENENKIEQIERTAALRKELEQLKLNHENVDAGDVDVEEIYASIERVNALIDPLETKEGNWLFDTITPEEERILEELKKSRDALLAKLPDDMKALDELDKAVGGEAAGAPAGSTATPSGPLSAAPQALFGRRGSAPNLFPLAGGDPARDQRVSDLARVTGNTLPSLSQYGALSDSLQQAGRRPMPAWERDQRASERR